MPIGPKNNRPINVTSLGGDDRIFTPAQPPHCRRYSRSNCDFWADSNRRLVGALTKPGAHPRLHGENFTFRIWAGAGTWAHDHSAPITRRL